MSRFFSGELEKYPRHRYPHSSSSRIHHSSFPLLSSRPLLPRSFFTANCLLFSRPPIPGSLHPAPAVVRPSPCFSRHPAPGTLHPAPGTRNYSLTLLSMYALIPISITHTLLPCPILFSLQTNIRSVEDDVGLP
jgi:hypothetical protein